MSYGYNAEREAARKAAEERQYKAYHAKPAFKALHEKAHNAGMEAGRNAVPVPMVVVEADGLSDRPKPGAQRFYEPEGACGFAWVWFKGNSAWGRWAVRAGLARSHYPSGVSIWVGQFNQSVARKEAYAGAYAKVLKEAGIAAYAGSRLD